MTLVVRARIEVDKGSAQADLRQASEAVKQVGDANREAATGAAALTSATNTMSAAQREAAQAVRGEAAAQDEATRAKIANTAAAGRQRAAYQQLGFQVQDVFQQFALGINPLVILAQQGGQVTSALALMGDTQQGTQSKFTRFMTFLSGPWGAAILGAVTIGGLLAQTLWDNEDAATGATQANDAYASAQSQLAKVMNLTTGEMTSQNVVLREQIRLLARKQILEGRKAEREADEALGEVGRPGLFTLFGANDRDRAAFEASTRPVRQLVEDLRKGKIEVEDFRKSIERLEKQGRLTSQEAVDVEEQGLNLAIAKGDQLVGQQMLDALDGKGLAAGLRRAPPKGPTPRKDTSADQAAREAERLLDFTAQTEERVQRITEQFDEQPRLVDQVAKASRELDAIQAEVEKRLKGQPEEIKKFAAAIDAARGPVEGALLRPFREMEEAGDRQLEQMMLVLQGRESEAEALQRIEQYQARNGDLTEEQRLAILAQVEAERELGRLIEARGRQLSIYNASIDDTRAALEDLLSGGSGRDFLKSMEQNFRQLQGRLLTEQLFGDALRKLEDLASGRDSLKTQTDKLVEELGKPGPKAQELADAMDAAAERINQAAQRIANPGLVTSVPNAVPAGSAGLGQIDKTTGEIVVQGGKIAKGPVEVSLDLKTFQFIKATGTEIGKAWLKPLENLIGTKLVNGIAGVFGGAVAGRAQGGDIGAILGGLKSIEGLPDGLKKVLGGADGAGGAFGGAVAGFRTSQIMDALGIGNSKSGAAIGGAIGSAIPIPGADIIGSIAGGLIGQALKPTKRGSATITSVDGDASSRGNDQERIQASLGLAGSVQQRLRQIAEEFDAEIGSFAVSIGQRGKNFRVDTSGSGKTKTKRGAIDFGQDEEAAVAFALRDAISDGAIKGLSAAIQKALNSNPDVDKAIKEALKVRDVEELLDGIGGKIRKEVRDFDRQADERLRIARAYGFDILEIERINAEERSKLIESILEDRVGALQDLLNDLVFGDLAEGTLSERRQRLLEEISKAEADAAKGVDGAADRLADLNRRLIQLSRDAYGTAGSEYASDRAQAIASAERIIQIENDRIRGTQEAAAETNRQLATANQLSNEQNDILAEINAGIRNLITLDGLNIAGGGGGNAGIDLGAIARSVNLK
ncbi:MAG: hypothetical protein A2792_19655 [Sphingomonadales bacterium RIFCSPHIGHO2_01_FULL_65_20]|nr:MAG: hypothetical protein A2792_19655 [Sphingomonadales bacterium RIFCSPHIGHO2_01_FULL_65_20]